MIKREHIKQAIDAISRRSPEIGYSLDQMLGMGVIDSAAGADQAMDGDNLHFVFDDEKVLVNKVLFFNEGTVPIEQGLLIKYGELVKKQELQDRGDTSTFREAYGETHRAGLRLVVNHEIDYAIRRLEKKLTQDKGLAPSGDTEVQNLIAQLEQIKADERPVQVDGEGRPYAIFYEGVVDQGTPAYFMRFPICMDSLMQVADINVEFFHVRFVLECLIRRLENSLLACLAGQNIVGLIYLRVREQFLKQDLEIKYLATLRGKTWDPKGLSPKPLKGVGTFLVAGVWMLCKNEMPSLKEIVLDAEVGARRFYEAVGFEQRGLSRYVLKQPKGYLLRAILSMTHHAGNIRERVIEEIGKLVVSEVKRLRKKAGSDKALSWRAASISAIQECLKPEALPELRKTASNALLKHQKKIPESWELLHSTKEHSAAEVVGYAARSSG